MLYYQATPKHVLDELSTSAEQGLSRQEAARRLERHGPNKLPSPPPIPWWRQFLGQFQDILTYLLLAATVVSFAAWLLEPEHAVPYETLAILAIVMLNAVLGYLQESRAEEAVAALQAMTGDGVNDAPALKAADIGVAMGITGTDVSKQAADTILMDDNFASIVAAVEEGRSIFKSIRAALQFLLSSNTGEILTMFLAVVFAGVIGLYAEAGAAVVIPLLAVQILWINLLTDSAPALALAMEPSDRRLMKRAPRDPRTGVISLPMWLSIASLGLVMALGTLLVMDFALPGGLIPGDGEMPYARTMAFTTLVFFQLFNIFNARSSGRSAFSELFRNRWIWAAVSLSAVLQITVVYLPVLQTAFGTVPLSFTDWIVCIATGSVVLWVNELAKLLNRS